jgi:hypothetical protein
VFSFAESGREATQKEPIRAIRSTTLLPHRSGTAQACLMAETNGHTTRLKWWDYSGAGAYFVTFTVMQRRPVLGTLFEGGVRLSAAGELVDDCWRHLSNAFPVAGDSLVIIPDHVHGF